MRWQRSAGKRCLVDLFIITATANRFVEDGGRHYIPLSRCHYTEIVRSMSAALLHRNALTALETNRAEQNGGSRGDMDNNGHRNGALEDMEVEADKVKHPQVR